MAASRPYSIAELNHLHDRAHVEALALRRQAYADFWRGVDDWVDVALERADRAATRFAHRMHRRPPALPAAVARP